MKQLQNRMELKRSFDNGTTRIFDVRDKRNKTLPELLIDPESIFDHEDELGRGEYGQAKLLKDQRGTSSVVAKVTGCNNMWLGDPFVSPFRSEQIEPRILNFLWTHLVETRVTPHIIAPVGKHAIVNGYTPEQKEEDKELESSLIFFMEPASVSDLRVHFRSITSHEFRTQFKPLLFQICYTLGE